MKKLRRIKKRRHEVWNGLSKFKIRSSLVIVLMLLMASAQAQECLHEVTLNDRYMGKVACYFPNEGNSTEAFMELGLFAREFAAHAQIDDTNNQVYLRRGRQVVRLMTTADISSGLEPTVGAIDYNGQSVESAMGLKANGIVYVPLNMMVNLFLGSSSYDASLEPARYNISTFADNIASIAQNSPAQAPATLNQTQEQINTQAEALATAGTSTQASTEQVANQIGQVAQTPATNLQPALQAPVPEAPEVEVPTQQAPATQASATPQAATQALTQVAQQAPQTTGQAQEIFRIAKPRIGQHDTYTRVAIDLPVGSGYEISVKGNTFVVVLPNMEALGFEYTNDDRFIKDIGFQLIDNTLALVVTTNYLMSADGYGYRIGTLPPSATRVNEVLYVDFGEEITSSTPPISPYFALAMEHHQRLSPTALYQLQTLLQVSAQNATVVTEASVLPATADYSQELMPDGVQVNALQTNAVQANTQMNGVQTSAEIQSQAIQGIIQNTPAESLALQQQPQDLQAATNGPQAPLMQANQVQQAVATDQLQPSETAMAVQAQQQVQQQIQTPQQATAVEVLPLTQTSQAQTVPATQVAQSVEQAVEVPQDAVLSAQRSAGFSVVIDPGHGGVDPGATGLVIEEEVVLDVSLKLKDLLEQAGIEVIMTRTDDSSLRSSKRADLAARAQQATVDRNLFVSIHANAARNRDAHGVETWVFGKPLNDDLLQNAINENGGGKVGVELTQEMSTSFNAALLDIVSEEQLRFSKILAESIQSQMVAKTGAKDRGIKENYFYVIRNAQSPAVLVEIGFVNHPEEGEKLATDEYRGQLAEGLYDGILGFFSMGGGSTSGEIANQ